MGTRRFLPTFLTALLVGALLLLGVAPGARAHSDLLSSDPEDGAHLEAMPATVTLVFNEDIDPQFAQAVVADSENVARPTEPTVSRATMTVPIPEGVDDGLVEVRYRIVSADGHPVAGLITFTAGATTPTTAPGETPASVAPRAAEPSEDTSTVWMYVLTGLAAALVVGVALVIVLMTRRRTHPRA